MHYLRIYDRVLNMWAIVKNANIDQIEQGMTLGRKQGLSRS